MKLGKHLRKMDELKQSVQLAVHEQIHYFTNLEAFNLFRAMIDNVTKKYFILVQRGFTGSRKPTNSRSEKVRQQDDYQLSKDELLKANRELDKPNKTSNRNHCARHKNQSQ
jgi:preprotein translocase subunit SecA